MCNSHGLFLWAVGWCRGLSSLTLGIHLHFQLSKAGKAWATGSKMDLVCLRTQVSTRKCCLLTRWDWREDSCCSSLAALLYFTSWEECWEWDWKTFKGSFQSKPFYKEVFLCDCIYMFPSVMVMTDILMEKLENKCEFNHVFADVRESHKQQIGASKFTVLL